MIESDDTLDLFMSRTLGGAGVRPDSLRVAFPHFWPGLTKVFRPCQTVKVWRRFTGASCLKWSSHAQPFFHCQVKRSSSVRLEPVHVPQTY